jgi:hypothetical protein
MHPKLVAPRIAPTNGRFVVQLLSRATLVVTGRARVVLSHLPSIAIGSIGTGFQRGSDVNRRTIAARTTRVRGLAPWRPITKSRALLDAVNAILVEYSDYLPLTVRQLFYRLVGAHGLGSALIGILVIRHYRSRH